MTLHRGVPTLSIPTTDSTESQRNIYSLPNSEVYDLKLPVPYNNRCIGSSHGWLVFIDAVTFMVTLSNPFYFGNVQGIIRLPAFIPARDFSRLDINTDFFAEYYIHKAILSADPSSCPNYTVMMIYGVFSYLGFCKPGDEYWTYIANPGAPSICDLIYSNGRFMAVNMSGEVFTTNAEGNTPQLESISNPLYYNPGMDLIRRYIVVSNDGNTLFQVVRSVVFNSSSNGDHYFRTLSFSVYTLAPVGKAGFKWFELSCIGDVALFLGDNHSYCVRASAYPGIVPNAIYYTDDYHGFETVSRKPYQYKGPFDAGIYEIGEGTFLSHYMSDHIQNHRVPHIWIMPTI